MDKFPVHTIETAPQGSQATLRHVSESLGMIPNLAAAMSESPTLVRSFFAVRDIYAQGSMSRIDIEVLSLTNAFENGCQWCMAFHSAGALKAGLSKDDVNRLRAGEAPADPRLRALSNFARALMKGRGHVSALELDAFYAAGFCKSQALEVVLGAGFSVLANFSGHLTHAPLGAAFEPHAWSKSEARSALLQTSEV